MSRPDIHGSHRTVSGSLMISTVGRSLQLIKSEDALTDEDLGTELGKSEDQGRAYRKGESEMSMTTFLRGCRRWNGRFANPVLALLGMKLVMLDEQDIPDRQALTVVMRAQVAMSENLENDEAVTDAELEEDRAIIESAGAVYDNWRRRLAAIDRRKSE